MPLHDTDSGAYPSLRLPASVTIVEVGLRDGLQNEPGPVPTSEKIRLLEFLVQSGIQRIEVTSFVHPKLVPQLADAEAVIAGAPSFQSGRYSALVPNEKGYDRALAVGLKEVCYVLSVSEGHNRKNVRCSVDESLQKLAAVALRAAQEGVSLRVSLATAFGCPFEGEVPPDRVLRIARRAVEAGASEVVLADTIGVADPAQVYRLFCTIQEALPGTPFAAHFHDTRGMGLANVLAAMQAGITIFDASIGGLGGCPFAPGATGNIATEDLVHMLHKMGISTGVDLGGALKAALFVEKLIGRRLPGHMVAASGGQSCV